MYCASRPFDDENSDLQPMSVAQQPFFCRQFLNFMSALMTLSPADRRFFTSRGFTQEDFAAVVWMTSWALLESGTEAQLEEKGDVSDSPPHAYNRRSSDASALPKGSNSSIIPNPAAASNVPVHQEPGGGLGPAYSASGESVKRKEAVGADMTLEEKRAVGAMCKMLIDAARVQWLQSRGMEAEIVEYIDPQVTPENKLILAVAKSL